MDTFTEEDILEVSFVGNISEEISHPSTMPISESTLRLVLEVDILSDTSRTQLMDYVNKISSDRADQIEDLIIRCAGDQFTKLEIEIAWDESLFKGVGHFKRLKIFN